MGFELISKHWDTLGTNTLIEFRGLEMVNEIAVIRISQDYVSMEFASF